MKENHLLKFVDWYIVTKENKKISNYINNFFRGEKETFILGLIDYAIEYSMAFNHNPFSIEKGNIGNSIKVIEANLYTKKENNFEEFSSRVNRHMPKAILGRENYLKYLLTINETKNFVIVKEIKQKKNKLKNSSTIFQKEELESNFFLRLTTQDRLYNFLYFPISVLKKIFYKSSTSNRDFFNDWINKQISSIQFITNEKIIYFSDIKELKIKNAKVFITSNENIECLLHTKIAGKDLTKEIQTDSLKKISIDHIVPFEKVLNNLKDELPVLSSLNQKLIELNNGFEISNRKELKVPGNLFIDTINLSDKNFSDLKKELNLISSNLTLQIMDCTENLKKKKYD